MQRIALLRATSHPGLSQIDPPGSLCLVSSPSRRVYGSSRRSSACCSAHGTPIVRLVASSLVGLAVLASASACTAPEALPESQSAFVPSEVIDLGALVTEDLPERVWGNALLEQRGYTESNSFPLASTSAARDVRATSSGGGFFSPGCARAQPLAKLTSIGAGAVHIEHGVGQE